MKNEYSLSHYLITTYPSFSSPNRTLTCPIALSSPLINLSSSSYTQTHGQYLSVFTLGQTPHAYNHCRTAAY